LVLAALSAGAIGLGAFALEDLDGAISQDATQASLTPLDAPGTSSQKSSSELAGLSAGLDALSDFATATPTRTATATSSPSPTATEVPPTATELPPTETPVPPTETPIPPTDTAVPPTETPVPPTATPVPPTPTPEPPTPTPTVAVPENVPLLGDYVPPTATPTATVTQTPSQGPNTGEGTEGLVAGNATRYADSLEGKTMACGGVFDQDNAYVVAVSLQYDQTWRCGDSLEICGSAGCITGVRTDTCPGCPGADIDMSRAGVQAVCGNQTGCAVVIRKVQ
jgi:outer membrane biosynthesis protein TonB